MKADKGGISTLRERNPGDKALDTLYEKIGGVNTCRQISEAFHDRIEGDPVLRPHFPKNTAALTEHFALFLAERLGGPADYTTKRGKTSLGCRHAHLPIGAGEAGRWLGHMDAAMEEIGIPGHARHILHEYFTQTAATLADPFLALYHLPLDELRARLQENPALATTYDHGRTLIRKAAMEWDAPRVQLLIEFGADVNGKDLLGHDPLYRAANGGEPGREEEGRAVVELLIRHGANVNARSESDGMTPLHMAARRGTVPIAEALLDAGAHIEARDAKGETPLRRAVNCGKEDVVHLLLARGADPLSPDKQNHTPLDAARHERIRQALLNNAVRPGQTHGR